MKVKKICFLSSTIKKIIVVTQKNKYEKTVSQWVICFYIQWRLVLLYPTLYITEHWHYLTRTTWFKLHSSTLTQKLRDAVQFCCVQEFWNVCIPVMDSMLQPHLTKCDRKEMAVWKNKLLYKKRPLPIKIPVVFGMFILCINVTWHILMPQRVHFPVIIVH